MGTPQIKICRVDTLAGAKLAAGMGANYIGLHAIDRESFTAGRRERFRIIGDAYRAGLLGACEPVLLTKELELPRVVDAVIEARVRAVQLHTGQVDPDWARELKRACPGVGVWKALSPNRELDVERREAALREDVERWIDVADCYLFDSDMSGGTGTPMAVEDLAIVARVSGEKPRLIAGGLTPLTVLDALARSGATGADAQTCFEIKRIANEPRSLAKDFRQKDVTAVARFLAAARKTPLDQVLAEYRRRRADTSKMLISPSELPDDAARMLIIEAQSTAADGLQVDCGDGTANVPKEQWTVSASEWADRCMQDAPELPLWLHVFSRSPDWIAVVVAEALSKNPHLVGVLVQPDLFPDEAASFADDVASRVGVPIMPSVTTGAVLESQGALKRKGTWQVTAPKTGSDTERAERLGRAVRALRERGADRVLVDRGIALPVLARLSARPEGATMGRGLLHLPVHVAIDTAERMLLRAGAEAERG